MSNLDSDQWGTWSYDRTPANKVLNPDDLYGFLTEAQEYPEELARQAHISLELATHPKLPENDRWQFAPIAIESYDKLVKHEEADLTTRFIHAYLPIILPTRSKTERKKAMNTVRDRAITFADRLIALFDETEDDGTKRQTIGHAAELLVAATARQLGYDATPSQYRQDHAVAYVDGLRYGWDVTVRRPTDAAKPMALLQVKHRDFADGKADYHGDITVHRVFRAEERMNLVAPKVFELLRTALQINGLHDHGRFNKFSQTLAQDITTSQRR